MNTIDFAVMPNYNYEDKVFGNRIMDMYVSYKQDNDEEARYILFDFMFVTEA